MTKIFLDSDVLLDLFFKRDDFESISEIMTNIVDKRYIGYTSPIVIANIHYLMTKLGNKKKSLSNIKKLRTIISILTIDEKIIDDALSLNAVDFEDSIQFLTAEKNHIDCIITRNKKDFKKSKLPIYNAKEFLELNET